MGRGTYRFAAALFGVAMLVAPAGTWAQEAGEDSDVPESLSERETYRQELFDEIAPSVVFITRDDSMGSGFFVSDDGLALTNKHVVGERDEVDVVLHDGRTTSAEVVERAEDVDLALIRLSIDKTEPLTLGGAEELRVGSWVASVGHGMGGVWTFTKGMVSNIYPTEKDRPIFQTQIPLNPGASGAPIFDQRGRVVGVVTSGVMNSNSINFAIRIDVALETLDKLGGACRCLTVKAPENVPIFVDGETVGQGPEVVVPVDDGETVEVFAVIDGEMHKTEVTYPETKAVDLEDVGKAK
jgi:S1-C subfamily serine protease